MSIYRNLPDSSATVDSEPYDYIEVDHTEDEKDFEYTPKKQVNRTKRRYRKRKNMHPLESGGVGVPAFLAKLWRLVEDSETNNLISWSQVSTNLYFFANILLKLSSKSV